MRKLWLPLLAVLIFVAALMVIAFTRHDTPLDENAKQWIDQLETVRVAIAATENLESEPADEAWAKLFASMPSDPSIALNRALNRTLQVDALVASTTNALLDAEAKQAARQQLPAAIEQAKSAIDDYTKLANDPVTTLWLASRIDLQEASLLPTSLGKSQRRELFENLCTAVEGPIQKETKSILLGGLLCRVLDELESPINGIPKEIQARAASVMSALSKQHSDNLFIALRAARLNLDVKSDRAAAAVKQTLALSRAIEPSLKPQTQSIGLTPDELVNKIVVGIETQDWQAASNQMRLWFNVLNSTDLVKTDRRRASPHPLDRLSFDTLRRLSAEVARNQPIASGNKPLQFERLLVGEASELTMLTPVDLDLDLDADIVTFSSANTATAWLNDGANGWKQFGAATLDIKAQGVLVADLFMVDASDSQRLQTAVSSASRHATLQSLLVYGNDGVRLVTVDGRGTTAEKDRLVVVTKPTGLEDVKEVASAIAGDLEGDGDLDLVFATRNQGLRIFINRGNRTFFEARTPVADDDLDRRDIAALAIVDLDRDLDLDVVAIDGKSGRVGLLENLLHLQFRFRELADVPVTTGANQITVADIDGNVSWDLIVGGGKQSIVVYSQTADAGAWTVDRTEQLDQASGKFLFADFDNDSWPEWVRASDRRATVKRLAGKNIETAIDTDLDLSGPVATVADFDRNGKLDVLAVADGKATIFRNTTESAGHYLDVRFRGIDDNNANSGRVNHYAIGSVVELRFGPHYRATIITEPTTHFGLDGFDKAASLRIIFPNGLTQTIREPAIDMLVEEEQILKGSCPYLYAWDGAQFMFVTDCLWAAPLGLQVAAGVVAKDRPWEYLKVNGDFVNERDGNYELRITEELWEVAYFDHVSLMAVDHPSEVDVWTNEKVGPPEIAKRTIFAFAPKNLLPLKNGTDSAGRDVTQSLRTIDRTFVQGFDRRLRQGLCPPHWIDLDFGTLPENQADGAATYLVLTGWILPTDTSLNIQIDQNPELPAIEFPSVWVPDATQPEGWRNAIPFMGFPGGKTKTIVVDVTSVLNRADPRFRIRTSAQIYWDAAQLATVSDVPELVTNDLELRQAELQYHGFSNRLAGKYNSPESYDYAQSIAAPKWPPLQGRFTQFGDCLPLLKSWDDELVVMGSGDELRLSFAAPKQPLPAGWKRDFILHCVGWDKDADLNTLTGQSSLPLPYKAMHQYPPTQSQIDDQDRVQQLNDHHLQRTQEFRKFWQR